MKNILLTGGAGYIGSHTVIELLENGFTPICVDNFTNSSPEVFDRLERITGQKIVWYDADIQDKNLLCSIVEDHAVDGAIHFAGYKAVGESVANPLMYYSNNIDSTIILSEVCRETGVKNIVFSSSATVYGNPQDLPLDEEHPLSATNPYGNCKLFIEYILKDLQHAYNDMNVALLRYFNPVGAHKSYLLGENPKGIPNNLMPFICQTASGVRQRLSIFGNDYETLDGTGVRDYIHVVDLAKGHVAALNKLSENPGCVTYNLGTGKGTSVLELVMKFMHENDVEVPFCYEERRQGDIAACWANPEKAARELNWTAKLTIEDMVIDSWEAHRLNKECAL